MSNLIDVELSFYTHCKEVIFDNGKTSAEYYYKPKSNILFITFDSVNIRKENEPFGLNFLRRLDVDILAFRKKAKHGYTPDFSYEIFYEVVKDIVIKYDRVIAYGFSLGGYAALYYGSRINCEIFAIAPRVPSHPIYGTKIRDKLIFNHDLNLKFNDKIEPFIAYDPHNKIDNRYFKNQILPNFPNLKLIKSNYAGHKVAQHYVQMNVLKQMVFQIYKGQTISYNKKLRFKSLQYLSILSETCMKKGKYGWAYDIADKALKIDYNDERANRVKMNIELNKVNQHLDNAVKYAKLLNKDKKDFFRKLSELQENMKKI